MRAEFLTFTELRDAVRDLRIYLDARPDETVNHAAARVIDGLVLAGARAHCELEALRARYPEWTCKAKAPTDPPQDCDWPTCGCDPSANKVIGVCRGEDCTEHPDADHEWVCLTCLATPDKDVARGIFIAGVMEAMSHINIEGYLIGSPEAHFEEYWHSLDEVQDEPTDT